MAGYDQLNATHDMMLRFMGMNFSAITDGTARIPSSVGDDEKPSFIESKPASAAPMPSTTKTPEQDKAMWEGTTKKSFQFENLISQPCSLLQRRISCNCPSADSRWSWHSVLVSRAQAATSGTTHLKERGRIHPTDSWPAQHIGPTRHE